VLESAFAVFLEKGFDAFTIAEVAARAAVHETSIYRRWKTRSALALDACLHFAQAALPIPDTGSFRSDLLMLLDRAVAVYSSPQGQALLRLSTHSDAHAVTARKRFLHQRFELTRVIFDRAISRGEFPTDGDSRVFLEALLAPLYMRALLGQSLKDWPRNEMVDRLLNTDATPRN